MNVKEAKEIYIKGEVFRLKDKEQMSLTDLIERAMVVSRKFGEAKGYLAALEGEEVKALVEAAQEALSWGLDSIKRDQLKRAIAAFRKAVKGDVKTI